MYLPNTARSVLRARPVRAPGRSALPPIISQHASMDHAGVLHATVANSRRTHAQDADTAFRHSYSTLAARHVRAATRGSARAFLPLTRTTLFMVSRKDGLHRRESTSQSTDLTLRGRETRHMSPQSCTSHARGRTHLRPHDCNLELRIVVVAFAWRHVIVVPPGGRGPRSRMEPIERVPRCPPRAPDAATTMRSTSF